MAKTQFNKQLVRAVLSIAAAGALAVPLLIQPAAGQFPAESTIPKAKRKGRRMEKGPDGPTPRTPDGKVDFSGVWGYAGITSDIAKDYDVGQVPMTELGDKLFKERQANLGKDDPEARCLPTGIPRRDPYPSKIVQTKDLLVVLYEGNIHSFRQIFLDGRKHDPDANPTWYGYSYGHWEGNDTLVVETVGFNGLTWLDMAGHPTSDKLKVTERFTRPNLGTLVQETTIEDPVMYTKPWVARVVTPLMKDGELIEYICTENNLDVQHLYGK